MRENAEGKKTERIGKTVFGIAYLVYALKFILTVSAVSLAVLWFLSLPLWLAPIVGVGAFLIYRAIYRAVFGILYLLSQDRRDQTEDEDSL